MNNPAKGSSLTEGHQRVELMEELYKRHGAGATGPGAVARRFHYWRKKYAWILVVGGAKLLKRTIDIGSWALAGNVLVFIAVSRWTRAGSGEH